MNVSPAAAPCPKCRRRGNLQWRWKPDQEPTDERLRCYRCGWDTDWIRYGTLSVTLTAPEREAVSQLAGTAA